MSSQYKLTYFNKRGRAEIARLLFTVAGVEYEDHRIEFADWPAIKDSTPLGQIPVLEVDGVKLCQSYVIAEFLARRFNLAGRTDIEQARSSMLAACFDDIIRPCFDYTFSETDAEKKEKLKSKYLTETLPKYLDQLDKLLIENNGGNGYFVGDGLTLADIVFVALVDWLTIGGAAELVNAREKLTALRRRVEGHPKIAKWIVERPESDW